MRTRVVGLVCAAAWLAATVAVLGQEGHPLTGTWSGDWGPSTAQRNHLTVVMSWDGKNVTGTINPGPDAIPIGSVFLDVTNWNVRIEADAKDKDGKPARLAAEGRLDDISSYHRTLTGTWSQGAAKGDFKLTRD